MIYQDIFNRKFYILNILLIIGLVAAFYFFINKTYWDKFDYLKNNKFLKMIFKLILPTFIAGYMWFVSIPIIQDKPLINKNKYVVITGTVTQEVVDGGLLGLSRSIIIKQDGMEYEFKVAWADNNIKKGDTVLVTYLPHSKYAIIELKAEQ
ncbi:hypothetical protein CSX00_09230 [Pseudobutyrivibrio ruminis]|uniref:Uncharacterized protein n=1 Tax=Pseudobutyrivibrio ruminis TaxID=46206 RepID=A0A2G3E901_9FIRM|nr:hypothetical protein [Pseudobutyrivibrio ruminis]PHU39788.1 hypothetical protein CSX00_09230 [Pseudobutyrivibrio ruminis]